MTLSTDGKMGMGTEAKLRWGILGPGRIARDFAGGVARSRTGRLVAIGTRDAAKPGLAEAFPGARIHAGYEALLADPEREIRELLVFCGLPFDSACLDYHHAKRSVRTASAAQVRQPLQRDTARASRYGALLDPLRFGLGLPTID